MSSGKALDRIEPKESEVETDEKSYSASRIVVTSPKKVKSDETVGEKGVISNLGDNNEHEKINEAEAGIGYDSIDIDVTIGEKQEFEREAADTISDKLNEINYNDSDSSQDEWEITKIRMETNELNKDKTLSCAETSSPSQSEATPEKCEVSTSQSQSSSSVDVYPKTKSLDNFIVETEKNLSIPESSTCPKRTFEPPNTGNIVFDLPVDLENIQNRKSRAVCFSEKMKLINNIQDSTPGLKRTLLKVCLKKEIEEKKVTAFNKRKENESVFNELEDELDFEEDENNEDEYELSEDEEEAAASFDKEEELGNENANSATLFNKPKENERVFNELEDELDFEVDENNEDEDELSEDEQAAASFDKEEELGNETGNSATLEDDCNDDQTASKLEKNQNQSKNPDDDDSTDSIAVIDEIREIDIVDVIVPKGCVKKHPRRSKKVKVLEEDSNSNDCCVVFETKSTEKATSKGEEEKPDSTGEENPKSKREEENPNSKREEENPNSKIEEDNPESKREEKQSCNEDSSDSIIFLADIVVPSKSIKHSVDETNVQNDENESSNMELSASIPSFQPHGGFACESEAEEEVKDIKAEDSKILLFDKIYNSSEDEEDAVKEAESKIMPINKRFSMSKSEKDFHKDSNASFEALPVRNERDADTHQFNLTFDYLPVSQHENERTGYTSQDVENICSGAFKSTFQKTKLVEDVDTHVPVFSEPKESDFIEMEAELSGEDYGNEDDDEQNENEDDVLDMVDDDEEPNAEKLREDVAGFYLKQQRNEDNLQLHYIQEKIIPDGELNNCGKERKRKYVWENKNAEELSVKSGEEQSSDENEDDETWIKKDKTQFLQEQKEKEESDMSISYKKPSMKIKILGRQEFTCSDPEDIQSHLNISKKRSIYMDYNEDEASQIVKKLKTDECGSKAIKHVLFDGADGADSSLKKNDRKTGTNSSMLNELF